MSSVIVKREEWCPNAQSRRRINPQGEKNDLFTELWKLCAGPLGYVPRAGDKVFYFPQGHIEQVEAYMNQDGRLEMPIYNLPSKILCKIVYVQLKGEEHTDEVFAQVTLLPEADVHIDTLHILDELHSEIGNSRSSLQRTRACSFSKILTHSDISTHGGFSVPKKHADECLPPLDMSQQPPVQELVAKDLHGFEWHFRHIYRGQPKRHLLTSGWGMFVTSKKLVAGDVCIFLRGENGDLRIGIRRATKFQNNSSTSVISGHSMQHGILAGAFHAISTGTMFTVYYRPWTSPSEFIIPYDQYKKTAENDYSVGTRLRMQFEGADCAEAAEQRYPGTVVCVEDIDRIRWPNSKWRCLKVQWDATTDKFVRPERVSPWNISVLPRQKRVRELDPSSLPECSSRVVHGHGLQESSVEVIPESQEEVFQGQEIEEIGVHQSIALKPPSLLHLVPSRSRDGSHTQLGLGMLYFPMHDTFYQSTGNTTFSGGKISNSILPNHSPMPPAPYGVCEKILISRTQSVPNANSSNFESQEWKASELNDEIQSPTAKSSGSSCMVFGVKLFTNPPELPLPQAVTYCHLQSRTLPLTSQSSVSESIQTSDQSKTIPSIHLEKQCDDCSPTSNRRCTKVLKYGTALGRSVDLTRYNGYNEVISALDNMFHFKGNLLDGSSDWHVIYTDDEGDLMPIGDVPWHEFCTLVRKIYIYPPEEIERLNLSSSAPASLSL